MIPYSRQKNISSLSFPVHDNSKSHTCHIIPPFGFFHSHACRSCTLQVTQISSPVFLPQFIYNNKALYICLKKHRADWAIENKNPHKLLSIRISRKHGCDPRQLSDLSLTFPLYIDPERSLTQSSVFLTLHNSLGEYNSDMLVTTRSLQESNFAFRITRLLFCGTSWSTISIVS